MVCLPAGPFGGTYRWWPPPPRGFQDQLTRRLHPSWIRRKAARSLARGRSVVRSLFGRRPCVCASVAVCDRLCAQYGPLTVRPSLPPSIVRYCVAAVGAEAVLPFSRRPNGITSRFSAPTRARTLEVRQILTARLAFFLPTHIMSRKRRIRLWKMPRREMEMWTLIFVQFGLHSTFCIDSPP